MNIIGCVTSMKSRVPVKLYKPTKWFHQVTEIQKQPDSSENIRGDLIPGSLVLRHVDSGSCNGCEIEISGCFSPTYDLESYGISLTASPRHSDGLLVTGVVTVNMREALQEAYSSVPEPKVVVALGDCAINCNGLRSGYGVAAAVPDLLPVDLEIPGCPPSPTKIIQSLRTVSKR